MQLPILLLRQQQETPTLLLMLPLKQQRKLLLLRVCRRGAERNIFRELETLWLLPSTRLVSMCRWMWRPLEDRGPLSSQVRLKRRRSKITILLVLRQRRRDLPLLLTTRNGRCLPTRSQMLRQLRSQSRCWTRRWPRYTPPCPPPRAQPRQQPAPPTPTLQLRHPARTKVQLLPHRQLRSTLTPGSRLPC